MFHYTSHWMNPPFERAVEWTVKDSLKDRLLLPPCGETMKLHWLTARLLENTRKINLVQSDSRIRTNCLYIYIYIYIYIHSLTGYFIRYTLLVLGWTPFCLQSCLNSSWHRFNKVLKTFLRDWGPYWHDSITQLLQICRLHIHDANLPFLRIQKVLYWIEIWWLWRPFE